MKKARILIVALVCSVMLMGVGFAYWTDAITFTGTVNTGNMDVVWSAADAVADGAVATADASVDAGAKNVTFTFANTYPGAQATIDASFINNSSIPVKLATLTGVKSGDLAPYLLFSADTGVNKTWKTLDACLVDAQRVLPVSIAAGATQALPTIYVKVDETLTNLELSNGSFTVTGNFLQFNQP